MMSDPVVEAFERGVLPEPFDHRAHVAMCWRFLRVYGVLGTLDRLPAALRRAVAALGVPERFHTTLTWAWILEVAERLDDSPDPDAFLARHPELLTNLVAARYGDALGHPDARARFVLPPPTDLQIAREHGPFDPVDPAVRALVAQCFDWPWETLAPRFAAPCVLHTAHRDGELVGFKLGLARDAETFHSTLGAVRPDARGQGVARALMRAQHAWAAAAGYRRVTTSTRNRFPAMLHLDLAEGFEIVGTTEAPEGGVKILLAKAL